MRKNISLVDAQLVRYAALRRQHPEYWQHYEDLSNLSWLYYDQALEGTSLTELEMEQALAGDRGRHFSEVRRFEEIRLVLSAIGEVRERASSVQSIAPLSLETLKWFHVALCSSSDPSAGRYRKGEGTQGPYSHKVTRPPSISYRLRKLVSNIEQVYVKMHPIRGAAHIHHEFMMVCPFEQRSGSAGRLMMNFWLLCAGYPPAIIHATERQAYFDALAGTPEDMADVLTGALQTSLLCTFSHFERASLKSMVA